jgi:hypothetical protein
MTRNRSGLVFKWVLSILAILIILGYTAFNSRIFIAGPQLEIHNPIHGSSISDSPLVKIDGTAKNISSIRANDKWFPIDSDGNFSEPVLLKPGHNIIYIEASDKFGRTIEQNLELFYTGSTPEISLPVQEEEISESLENI